MNRFVLILAGILTAGFASGEEITFVKRPTQVNDTSRQTLRGILKAERTIRQQRQIVDTSKQQLLRNQTRTLTVLDIGPDGIPRTARLRYAESASRIQSENRHNVEVTQPVAGNTYLVSRQGEELSFRDEAGQPVTKEEQDVLKVHMDAFGKPNPLANFLNGKRLQIGQSIEVPKEVARELLGLTGNEGKTDKLTLRLDRVQPIQGVPCAVFGTILRSTNPETSMTLIMKGQLTIEVNSCRTRSIALQGPIAISETKGPTQGQFIVSTNGTLDLEVQNEFAKSNGVARSNRLLR